MKNHAATLLLLLFASLGFAQTPGRAYSYLDIGQVRAQINNSADHFLGNCIDPQYEVPKGSGKSVNFATSLWVGGLDGFGNLKVAAQTYRQQGFDFFPGPYRPSHNYDSGRGFQVNAYPKFNGVVAVDNNKWMVIHDDGFAVYDPVSTSVVYRSTPGPRFRLQAVHLPNGKTLLFGDRNSQPIQDAYLLDPGMGYQLQNPIQLNYLHEQSAAVSMGNGLVLIAGLAGTEIYNPATHTSMTTQQMPVPVTSSGAVLLPDGRVFLAGGTSTYGTNFAAVPARIETQLFDPATNTWALGPNLPDSMVMPLTLLQPNGKVLLMGGSQRHADIYEFDPSTNSIATIGQLADSFLIVRGGLLPNGDVLYLGSSGGVFGLSGKGFVQNPNTSTAEEIPLYFGGAQAWTMPNGKAMIEFSSKEFREYDPSDRAFTSMRYQKVWKLTSAEIALFQQDFQNNTLNFSNYPDIATWPGNGITSKGEDAQLAPYVDLNNDGLYRPAIDGDYPCIMGDQALWWIFNDDGIHTESDGNALGVQVEGMAYAFDCNNRPCPDSNIAYSTFFHYEITLKSQSALNNAYVGLWNDVELGNGFDDYVGCDTTRDLGYVYNADAMDDGVKGYGANPPAFGVKFLNQTEMDNFISYNHSIGWNGNPSGALHHYNYLRGEWGDNTQLINNGANGHISGGAGGPSDFIYSGDPGACSGISNGWTEGSAGNTPHDRRMVQSNGPFTLQPGSTVSMDVALLWARGYYNNQLGSICELFNSSDSISTWWNNLDKSCFNLVMSNPPTQSRANLEVFPNPASSELSVVIPQGSGDVSVQVFDMAGRLIHERNGLKAMNTTKIDISSFTDGIYLLRCMTAKESYASKFVVKH